MSFQRIGSSLGIVVAMAVALLLLTPGPGSELLEETGHGHEESLRVAVEAAHTTLPAHFDASRTTAERVCSACLLQGRTMVGPAVCPRIASLLPVLSVGHSVEGSSPVKPQRRLDLSRAPPHIL